MLGGGGGGGLVFGKIIAQTSWAGIFVPFFFFLISVLFFIPVPCPRSSPSSPSPSFTCFYRDGLAPSDFEQAFVKKEKGKK